MPADDNGGMPRRVLIFDFDGVVVDTECVHFESWNAALHETLGVRLNGDYTQIVGRTLDELYETWTSSGIIPVEALDEPMKQRLLARKTDLFFEIGVERLTPVAGVAELVQRAQAQGWYTAIASRGRRLRLLRTLQIARLPAVFELVLGSDVIVNPTSDRKVHSRAARMFDADPADCVVIEDSAAGVADACASGIGWVIGLTTSASPEELYRWGADQVVSSLDQVMLPPPAKQ